MVEGYVDRVEWPAKIRATATSSPTTTAKIIADRPTNIRTIERYLLLAGDLPGLKFTTKLKPSDDQPAASTLVVEVTEKPIDVIGRVDNRGIEARGPVPIPGSATAEQYLGRSTRRSPRPGPARLQLEELQYVSAAYRQVLTSEGLTCSPMRATAGAGRARPSCELLNYKTRSTYAETGLIIRWSASANAI